MARAIEKGETQGFIKIVVDADTQAILGAAILGVGGDKVVHGILEKAQPVETVAARPAGEPIMAVVSLSAISGSRSMMRMAGFCARRSPAGKPGMKRCRRPK